jgi:hypothetical protein
MRQWLIRYIEHAFRGVALKEGVTLYEAKYLADYGFSQMELELSKQAERLDWKRVPVDHLFERTDAIFFMNSAAKKFYSPAIMRAVLMEGVRNGVMYASFLLDLRSFVEAKIENDVPFSHLYNAAQRAAIVRFCKFAAFNAPRELGREVPLRILDCIRRLEAPHKCHHPKSR